MAFAELQFVLRAETDAVFSALVDIARRPSLDPTITAVVPPAEPPAIGATFSGRGAVTGSDTGFEGMITGLDPPSLIAFGITFFNGARLAEEWRLTPTASGTLVRYTADLQLPGGIAARLLDRLIVGQGFRKQREGVLAHVRAALEADPEVAPRTNAG